MGHWPRTGLTLFGAPGPHTVLVSSWRGRSRPTPAGADGGEESTTGPSNKGLRTRTAELDLELDASVLLQSRGCVRIYEWFGLTEATLLEERRRDPLVHEELVDLERTAAAYVQRSRTRDRCAR